MKVKYRKIEAPKRINILKGSTITNFLEKEFDLSRDG